MTIPDERWDDRVMVWNGMAASVPALVVRPASARELAAAVAFAREHGLRVRIGRESAALPAERCVTLEFRTE